MDKAALCDLNPADVFREAVDGEGATYRDLKTFVQQLKHATDEIEKPLVTQHALVHLGAVLWSVSRTVRCFLLTSVPQHTLIRADEQSLVFARIYRGLCVGSLGCRDLFERLPTERQFTMIMRLLAQSYHYMSTNSADSNMFVALAIQKPIDVRYGTLQVTKCVESVQRPPKQRPAEHGARPDASERCTPSSGTTGEARACSMSLRQQDPPAKTAVPTSALHGHFSCESGFPPRHHASSTATNLATINKKLNSLTGDPVHASCTAGGHPSDTTSVNPTCLTFLASLHVKPEPEVAELDVANIKEGHSEDGVVAVAGTEPHMHTSAREFAWIRDMDTSMNADVVDGPENDLFEMLRFHVTPAAEAAPAACMQAVVPQPLRGGPADRGDVSRAHLSPDTPTTTTHPHEPDATATVTAGTTVARQQQHPLPPSPPHPHFQVEATFKPACHDRPHSPHIHHIKSSLNQTCVPQERSFEGPSSHPRDSPCEQPPRHTPISNSHHDNTPHHVSLDHVGVDFEDGMHASGRFAVPAVDADAQGRCSNDADSFSCHAVEKAQPLSDGELCSQEKHSNAESSDGEQLPGRDQQLSTSDMHPVHGHPVHGRVHVCSAAQRSQMLRQQKPLRSADRQNSQQELHRRACSTEHASWDKGEVGATVPDWIAAEEKSDSMASMHVTPVRLSSRDPRDARYRGKHLGPAKHVAAFALQHEPTQQHWFHPAQHAQHAQHDWLPQHAAAPQASESMQMMHATGSHSWPLSHTHCMDAEHPPLHASPPPPPPPPPEEPADDHNHHVHHHHIEQPMHHLQHYSQQLDANPHHNEQPMHHQYHSAHCAVINSNSHASFAEDPRPPPPLQQQQQPTHAWLQPAPHPQPPSHGRASSPAHDEPGSPQHSRPEYKYSDEYRYDDDTAPMHEEHALHRDHGRARSRYSRHQSRSESPPSTHMRRHSRSPSRSHSGMRMHAFGGRAPLIHTAPQISKGKRERKHNNTAVDSPGGARKRRNSHRCRDVGRSALHAEHATAAVAAVSATDEGIVVVDSADEEAPRMHVEYAEGGEAHDMHDMHDAVVAALDSQVEEKEQEVQEVYAERSKSRSRSFDRTTQNRSDRVCNLYLLYRCDRPPSCS